MDYSFLKTTLEYTDNTMRRQVLLFILALSLPSVSGQVSYSIPEEMEKGSLVCNLAQDLGLDVKRLRSGRARIHSGDSAEYIELNRERGVLLIKERIDRETLCGETTPCALHLQMILENPMELYRVTIEITDINDNAPSFASNEKRFEISESAVIGSKFVLEKAIDADIGTNNLQSYSLTPTNNFALKPLKPDPRQEKLPISAAYFLFTDHTHKYTCTHTHTHTHQTCKQSCIALTFIHFLEI